MTISLAAELDAFQEKRFPAVGMSKFWSSWGFGCALFPFLITGSSTSCGYVPQEVLTISQLGMKPGSINDFMLTKSKGRRMR